MSVHDPSSPTAAGAGRRRRLVVSGAAVATLLAGALLPAQNSAAETVPGAEPAVAAKAGRTATPTCPPPAASPTCSAG